MKVLLVNGSPNENGCTQRALQEISATLQSEGVDTEFFRIGSKPVGGCTSCQKCGTLKKCVFNDSVNEFREKAYQSDGFVFGSPVHYAGVAENLFAFMTRLFFSEFQGNDNRAFYLKPVTGIVSARRAGATSAFSQLNKFFTTAEMLVISSRYWNMVHGFTPEDVEKDEEGLFAMRTLGHNMAWVLRMREAADKAGVALPTREQPVFTHFIR